MKRKLPASLGIFVIATLTATLVGCGRSDRLPLNTVEGTVSCRGKPAEGVFVVFHPENPSEKMRKLRPAATTRAEGKFKLSTYGPGDGIPAGEYRVTAIWRGESEGNETDRLQGRYADPSTTPLKITIDPANLQPVNFDLK
ncbi:MAG: hypothetical protein JXM70_08220 [Pirellulales bacterium]|nr:hypothetical protein [Pirellulales bacterium]